MSDLMKRIIESTVEEVGIQEQQQNPLSIEPDK